MGMRIWVTWPWLSDISLREEGLASGYGDPRDLGQVLRAATDVPRIPPMNFQSRRHKQFLTSLWKSWTHYSHFGLGKSSVPLVCRIGAMTSPCFTWMFMCAEKYKRLKHSGTVGADQGKKKTLQDLGSLPEATRQHNSCSLIKKKNK